MAWRSPIFNRLTIWSPWCVVYCQREAKAGDGLPICKVEGRHADMTRVHHLQDEQLIITANIIMSSPWWWFFFSHLQPIRTSWLLRWLFDHERAKTRGIRSSEMRCGLDTVLLNSPLTRIWTTFFVLKEIIPSHSCFPACFPPWHFAIYTSLCVIFATARL